MGNRDLSFGLFAGLLLALFVAGVAAWFLMARTAPAERPAASTETVHATLQDWEVSAPPAQPAPEKAESPAGPGLEVRIARLETRVAELENVLRGRLPRDVRASRCKLLRVAFAPTGRYHENLPVYQPTRDGYWQRIGQDPVLHPEIERYRLLWFGGAWSDWLVPGKNDFDTKTNTDGTARLVWACFTDHEFQVQLREGLGERCLLRRNPFVDTGERIDDLPVYRPTGDDYWGRIGPDPVLHPEIKRYRYQPPGGAWSPWLVPGRNDVDDDVDPAGPGRLLWHHFGTCRFQVEFQ